MSDSVPPSTAKYNHPPPNGIAFTRILVRDLDRAQSFYSSVFGWRFMDSRYYFPRIFYTGREVMGGLHLLAPPAGVLAGEEGERVKQRVVDYIMVST